MPNLDLVVQTDNTETIFPIIGEEALLSRGSVVSMRFDMVPKVALTNI